MVLVILPFSTVRKVGETFGVFSGITTIPLSGAGACCVSTVAGIVVEFVVEVSETVSFWLQDMSKSVEIKIAFFILIKFGENLFKNSREN
jgi:ethanolamine transporter EutH